MSQPSVIEHPNLSARQVDALKLLSGGLTVNFTALVLRVKSTVIRRWITCDAAFRAELARRLKQKAVGASRRGHVCHSDASGRSRDAELAAMK